MGRGQQTSTGASFHSVLGPRRGTSGPSRNATPVPFIIFAAEQSFTLDCVGWCEMTTQQENWRFAALRAEGWHTSYTTDLIAAWLSIHRPDPVREQVLAETDEPTYQLDVPALQAWAAARYPHLCFLLGRRRIETLSYDDLAQGC